MLGSGTTDSNAGGSGENSNIMGSAPTSTAVTDSFAQVAPTPVDDMLPLIIGASVGGCCCLLLTILLIAWLVRRRRNNSSSSSSSSSVTRDDYFAGGTVMVEPIKRGSIDDTGTQPLSNSTSNLTMNRQQIYASAPIVDPTNYDTNTRSIVYDVAPVINGSGSVATQQIYGAAPPTLNASGGEYGAAPPEATSYGGMPGTATSSFTTYYGRVGNADAEESAETSMSSI
jgi:hypothetical protein